MSYTESIVKNGTLTLATKDYSCQPTSVEIKPTYTEQGDDVKVLDGSATGGKEEVVTRVVAIKAIADFTNPEGLQNYCELNDGKIVAFEFVPSGVKGPKFSGKCKIRSFGGGGAVEKRIENEIEFPIVEYKYTPPSAETAVRASK